MNTQISISYATVLAVETVKLKSEASKSAAIGGLWGAVANSGRHGGDALAGAALGAVLMGGTTKIAEGSNTAYSYTLKDQAGKVSKIMISEGDIAVNDCVSVEQGRQLSIKRVASSYCGNAPATDMADLDSAADKDMLACEEAKQALLEAPDDEVSTWAKKVRALCSE